MTIVDKRFSYNGNTNLKGPKAEIEWTPEQIIEYDKCMNDILYFAENYFHIVHIDHGLIKIPLTDYQKDILHMYQDERFVVLLQSRQSFKTTTTTIFILHFILFNNYKTVALLANKGDSAREILGRIQLSYENLPHWLQQGVVEWNKGSCELENGSKILAASTASSSVRSKSIALLYLDEYGFVPNNVAEDFMRSVYPTISSGKTSKIIMSSTPNGMNHFYKVVEDAKEKRNKYKLKTVGWRDVPGRDEKWKQETIDNIGQEAFNQEFDLKFIGSGGTLISGEKLSSLVFRTPIYDGGGLKQYKKPLPNRLYSLHVDVSEGLGLDNSTINVIDITNHPFEQVAVFKNDDVDPDFFPEIILPIAQEYNDATVLIERNDIGCKVADSLYHDLEYENTLMCSIRGNRGQQIGSGFGKNTYLGVKMTKTVKAQGCSSLKKMIEGDELIINDFDTITELSTFIRVRKSYAASDGDYDDIVMGLVSFSWMVTQKYFKELTNIDYKARMVNKYNRMIEESVLPFGFINNGLEDLVDVRL